MINLHSFVEDNLNLVIDKDIKKMLSKDEEIIFSDIITKYRAKL